jgi:hypothetical protein
MKFTVFLSKPMVHWDKSARHSSRWTENNNKIASQYRNYTKVSSTEESCKKCPNESASLLEVHVPLLDNKRDTPTISLDSFFSFSSSLNFRVQTRFSTQKLDNREERKSFVIVHPLSISLLMQMIYLHCHLFGLNTSWIRIVQDSSWRGIQTWFILLIFFLISVKESVTMISLTMNGLWFGNTRKKNQQRKQPILEWHILDSVTMTVVVSSLTKQMTWNESVSHLWCWRHSLDLLMPKANQI